MTRALLIQPPVYDTQLFGEWTMPSGLLKVSSWLRSIGYEIRLVDCLYPNAKGLLKQSIRGVVQVCSTIEWPLADYREMLRRRFKRPSTELAPEHRYKYEFGLSLERLEEVLESWRDPSVRPSAEGWEPDEVWITSIMTYWWESTRDTIRLVKKLYPRARIRVGGIYPTLAPDHLQAATAIDGYKFEVIRGRDLRVRKRRGKPAISSRDCIVTGEIPDASFQDLDFEAYRDMTTLLEGRERLPKYAILMTSRGCPFDCSYCAQKAYNEGSLKVRIRSAKDTFDEIRRKYHDYGIKEFAFYEDNFLLERANIQALLEMLLEHKSELQHLRLYAPEGVEVRLLHQDLRFVQLMKETGFDGIYLPLETMSKDVTRSWNRRHSHADLFEKAVTICQEANFRLHDMEVNAFILFGMPGEELADVVNTIMYASDKVGGIVPMLFTPVPGSIIYEQFESYLVGEMGFDLQHLNGKLYPFLRYNSERSGIRLEDYVALESLAFRLNAMTFTSTFPLEESNGVYRALRSLFREMARSEGAAKAMGT